MQILKLLIPGGGFLLLCRGGSETQQKSFCDMTDKENRIPGKTDRESFTGHRTGREEGEIKVERKSRLIPYEVANTISFSESLSTSIVRCYSDYLSSPCYATLPVTYIYCVC